MNNKPYFKKRSHLKIPQNEIIRLLKERHAKGLSLSFEKMKKGNSLLYRDVKYYWGGWLKGLKAMGLPTDHYHRWTKESVLEAFKERIRDGKPIHSYALLKDNFGLYYQMKKHFGSQEKLFKILEVEPRRPMTKSEVLDILRKQAKKSYGLTNTELMKIKIFHKMILRFGSKHNALKAMGLNDEEIREKNQVRKNQKWTAERVRTVVYYLNRHKENLKGGFISNTDESLYRAAINYFGSWAKALNAAGFKYDHPRAGKKHIKWDKEKVLKKIQELQKKHGHDNIPKDEKCILYRPSQRYFGSWKKALSVAETTS